MSFIPVRYRYASIAVALSDMIDFIHVTDTALHSTKGQTTQQVQLQLAKDRQGQRVWPAGRN